MEYSIDSVLYHHGIEGQKWGERNGPPYPLDKARSKQITKIKKEKMKNINRQEQKAKIDMKSQKLREKNVKIKGEWSSERNKKNKLNKKIQKLDKKSEKLEIKIHKSNAKIEKKISDYLKEYGSKSISDFDDDKIHQGQMKVEKALMSLSKQKAKTRRAVDNYLYGG